MPSDIFALGAILYHLLTGRPPFLGATLADTLVQVQTAEPQPPRHLNRAIPRDLETICLKCLRKKPGDRYGSAAALAEDLRRWREGRPILARPLGIMRAARNWWRRHWLPTVLGAALVLFGCMPWLWQVLGLGPSTAGRELHATALQLHAAAQGPLWRGFLPGTVARVERGGGGL